jgi:hypothetical protein
MRNRFIAGLVISIVSVCMFEVPHLPIVWYCGWLMTAVSFILLVRPSESRLLFRARRLDEREIAILDRIDSVSISIFMLLCLPLVAYQGFQFLEIWKRPGAAEHSHSLIQPFAPMIATVLPLLFFIRALVGLVLSRRHAI